MFLQATGATLRGDFNYQMRDLDRRRRAISCIRRRAAPRGKIDSCGPDHHPSDRFCPSPQGLGASRSGRRGNDAVVTAKLTVHRSRGRPPSVTVRLSASAPARFRGRYLTASGLRRSRPMSWPVWSRPWDAGFSRGLQPAQRNRWFREMAG